MNNKMMLKGVLVVVIAAVSCHLALAIDKGASVSLKARWNGTSYVQETAEFLVRCQRFQHIRKLNSEHQPLLNDTLLQRMLACLPCSLDLSRMVLGPHFMAPAWHTLITWCPCEWTIRAAWQ